MWHKFSVIKVLRKQMCMGGKCRAKAFRSLIGCSNTLCFFHHQVPLCHIWYETTQLRPILILALTGSAAQDLDLDVCVCVIISTHIHSHFDCCADASGVSAPSLSVWTPHFPDTSPRLCVICLNSSVMFVMNVCFGTVCRGMKGQGDHSDGA